MGEERRRIRVVIADGQPLYRAGLTVALEGCAEIELVGESGNGAEASALIADLEPDVAILDLAIGEAGALTANREARSATRVLLLSSRRDSATAYEAVVAGADGCLTKEVDRDAVCRAVKALARGEPFFSPEMQAALLEEIREQSKPEQPALTAREREAIALVAKGCSVEEIAGRLHISASTAKVHLRNAYGKLGTSGRSAAIAEAVRRGLVA